MLKRLFSTYNQETLTMGVALVFLLLPTGTAPPLIGVGLTFFVWVWQGGFKKIPLILGLPWFRPMLLFLALPWLGLIHSQNMNLGLDYAMKTKYWLLLFVSATCVMDDKRTFWIVTALWGGVLAGAVLAMGQTVGIVSVIRPDFPGFGTVHTLASMYLLVGILMAAFYFRRSKTPKTRVFYIFLILMFLFHLTVLKGRSGYLIFVLISPLLANDLMHKFHWAVKLTLAIFLGISLFISPVVRDRINSTVNVFTANKTAVINGEHVQEMPRSYILKKSFDVIKTHPFIGIGTGSLPTITVNHGPSLTHPHNSILYMGVSFGFLGIISILWVFWTMFSISWRSRHTPLGYFVFSSGLVLFIGGLFDSQILNTGTLIMMTMVYGFLNTLSRKQTGEA